MSTFGNFTVTRASTKNVLGSNGLLQSVANNVPAFEFNANGSYKGLLVEPGATNLATYSQAFGDASWSKANVTVSSDTTVAPDGTTTADSVLSNTVGLDEHRARKVSTMAINTAHTASIYVKKAGGVYAYIRDLTNNEFSIFDLDLVSVISTGVGQVSTIEPIGDYYRITTSFTTPGVITTNAVDFGFTTSSTLVGSVVPVGEGLIMWQAQLETGSVATSPIVTTGSTANRVADSVTLTGASSLIGQQEGTVVFSAIVLGEKTGQDELITGVNSAALAGILFTRLSTGFITSTVYDNGVDKGVIIGNVATTLGTRFVVAFGYKTGDSVQYVNGAQAGTNANAFTVGQALDKLFIADTTAFAGGKTSILYQYVALFPTRLSNAQLASLTTL
jgi:hypothetical protein